MAEAIEFPGVNRVYEKPPSDADDMIPNMAPIPAFQGNVVTYTCWKLSEREIEEINRTGEVWMAVRCGQRPMQPHWVGSLGFIKWACAEMGRFFATPDQIDNSQQEKE